MRYPAAVAVWLGLVLSASAGARIDYTEQIKPLLTARCGSCHGALAQKAKLRLDTASALRTGGRNGPAIVPGKSGESLLIQAVLGQDRPRMPPESEGVALTPEQVALLKAWIDQGAPAPSTEAVPEDPSRHWAFQKPQRPALPHPARHPIDAFIDTALTAQQLTARPEADRATLLRRLTLDLTGLPPTREELHAFLNDPARDAYEKVVDRLLASPRYGERWARHWMDVWRYSDWYGRRYVPDVWNSAPQIWRWRDWIVRSLNRDHGYDRMVREMLAADEIGPDDYEATVATGYLIRNWYALNPNDWMRSTVEHTGKAFLGLTFNCAHCHDHKYDPITQVDYFRLRAFFEPLGIRQDRVPGEADPGPFQEYNYSALRKVQRLGSVQVFDRLPSNPTWFYTGGDERNRVKERGSIAPGVPAFLSKVPLRIEPVNLPPAAWYPGMRPEIQKTALDEARARIPAVHPATPDPVVTLQFLASQAEFASLEARIRADQAQHGSASGDERTAQIRQASQLQRAAALARAEADLRGKERNLADVEARPMTDANRAKDRETATKEVAAARATRDRTAKELADPALAEKYAPLTPSYPKTSTGRRRALAEWITHRDQPLTARVAVNHLWMRHFHVPLVASVADLGRNGARPTHPQLLDWLAVEFMDSGWSMKHLHRLIVTSAAYRRVSSVGEATANAQADPENRWLWRMNTGRMEAEVLRDSVLFVSGKLDERLGGQELENAQSLTTQRRSLYYAVYPEDGGRSPLGQLFDGPEALECYRRTRSVLPQQALALTNSDLIHQMSAALAARLEAEAGKDSEAFIRAAFEQILQRPPTPQELAACGGYLAEQPAPMAARSRPSLLRVLFNHNDFLTIR